MLPANTALILRFLGWGYDDYQVSKSDVITIEWYSVSPQPTEQEIIDAGNDLTTIDGQLFSEWFAEHGGDSALTLRRKAKDQLSATTDMPALVRALMLITMDEINTLRAQHSLPARTPAQLKTAIRNKLNAGDADS